MVQFVVHIKVRALDVYHPSKFEQQDPKLYTSNVRQHMASMLGVPMSDYSLREQIILLKKGITVHWAGRRIIGPWKDHLADRVKIPPSNSEDTGMSVSNSSHDPSSSTADHAKVILKTSNKVVPI